MQTSAPITTVPTAPSKQAWFRSAGWDSLWILSPAFLSTGAVLLFRNQMIAFQDVPLWAWVTFVLLVDVAHVYATLFRTYLNESAFAKNRTLLTIIPGACWLVGALLYSLDALLFWRVLAYLAVFHFIRQQFGFVVLYSRKDPQNFARFSWINGAMVYMATLYPLMFWHTHMPRNFSWFVAGDFIESLPLICGQIGLWLYVATACAYALKEGAIFVRESFFNWPRNLLIAGTALSWWVGIITFNSDLAFTITNVVTHGIPYMALIWLYHHADASQKTESKEGKQWQLSKFLISNALLFIGFLAFLAYFEEGLWDGFVWREHGQVFLPFWNLPAITDSSLLALLIPFLALPQSTHYVLDGFIWRVKDRASIWST
jgi:hypothetical protein